MKENNQKDSNSEDLPKDAETTDVKREGWDADELGEQSAYEDATEMARQINRRGKTTNRADENDLAGSVESKETPQGRAWRKQEVQNDVSE